MMAHQTSYRGGYGSCSAGNVSRGTHSSSGCLSIPIYLRKERRPPEAEGDEIIELIVNYISYCLLIIIKLER